MALRLVGIGRAKASEQTARTLTPAALLVAAGEWGLAARELSSLTAPQASGLGQGTVDYLLARSLLNSGSEAYRERASDALRRAAKLETARLGSHDGPLIAFRALIRLGELTASAADGSR